MYKIDGLCPACRSVMEIESYRCPNCRTLVAGEFTVCEFCRLTDVQLVFLRVFLKSRGNIREVERELGISYPTVRARLDDLLGTIGIVETDGVEIAQDLTGRPNQPSRSNQPARPPESSPESSPERQSRLNPDLLDKLENDELTVDEVLKIVRGENHGKN